MTDTEKIAPITAEERNRQQAIFWSESTLHSFHGSKIHSEDCGHAPCSAAKRILAYEAALTAAEAEIERLKKHVVRLRAFIKADHILARAESAERRIAAALVPAPDNERKNGWTLSVDHLERIAKACIDEDGPPALETVESVILAALDAKEQS